MYFSIIIPSYNRAKYLVSTIDSIIKQSFEDWECLVIDDGSVDNTMEIVSNISTKDKRVKYYFQENSERGAARNLGIQMAKGKYICFLDSDDSFCQNHLESFHSFLREKQDPECMVFANSFLLDDNGILSKKTVPSFQFEDRFNYLLKYTPNPARVCVSSMILKELRFDPDIPGIEDFDLWLRIALHNSLFHLEKYTSIYRIHDEMYSVNSIKKYEKELKMFNYVFSKRELKNVLPRNAKNRLLSMCHFFISNFSFEAGKRGKTIIHGVKSLALYPKGYNGKTNKIIFANLLYSIPVLGVFTKLIYRYMRF